MATIAFPSLHPLDVRLRRLRSQSSNVSPFSLKRQSSDWSGRALAIEIDMQVLDRVDCAIWADFLSALDGAADNVFSFDVAPWSASDTPDVRNFKPVSPIATLKGNYTTIFAGTLAAIEDRLAGTSLDFEGVPFGAGWHGVWYEYEVSEEFTLTASSPGWQSSLDATN